MHSVGESLFTDTENWKTKLRQIKVSIIPDQTNNLHQLREFTSKQNHTLFVCFLVAALALVACGLFLFYRPGFYDFRLGPVSWFGADSQKEEVHVKQQILEEILRNKQLTLHEYNQLVHTRNIDQLMKSSIVTGKFPRLQFFWSLVQLGLYFAGVFALVFKAVGSSRIFQVDDSEIFFRLYHCVQFKCYFLFAVAPLLYLLSGVFNNFMTLSLPQQNLYWLLRLALVFFTCFFKLFTVDFKQIRQIMNSTADTTAHSPSFPFQNSSSLLNLVQTLLLPMFLSTKRRDLLNPSNKSYLRWAVWVNIKFCVLFLGVYRLLAFVAAEVISKNWFSCQVCHWLNGHFFDYYFFKEMFFVSLFVLLLYDLAFILTRLILSRGSLHFLYKRKNFSFLLKLLWQLSHSKTISPGNQISKNNQRKPVPGVRIPGPPEPGTFFRVRVRVQLQKRCPFSSRNNAKLEMPPFVGPQRCPLHREHAGRISQAVFNRTNGRRCPV